MTRASRAAAAILLALAALQLLSRFDAIQDAARGGSCREESDFHVESGEALLHGVALQRVGRAMPSYSVPNAFLCNHATPAASAAVRAAVLWTCALLVFALGALMYSGLCGAAAALVFSLAAASGGGGERWLYALSVLLAAWFLVRRAREPSPAKSVLLGAACGASLLVLSPLFLLPFALVLYEWARDRRGGAARARDAAALCLPPLLFLVPWVVMNWRFSGRFVLFEDARADVNLITGALGSMHTVSGFGDFRAMAGIPGDQSVLAWAAGEVLLRPLPSLAAFAARLGYAARLNPLLALAAAGSLWLSREREDCRQLALLACCFFAIHCLMPVMPSYFVPAWPLLAVLAGGAFSAWTRPASDRAKAVSAAMVHAAFALLLAVEAGALGLALAYPARARAAGALERALAADPDDAWLWSERGLALLRAGRPDEAVPALARSFSLRPSRSRELNHAWALLARGGPAARIWERRRPGRIVDLVDLREHVLRASWLALDGRPERASVALAEARRYAGSPEAPSGLTFSAGSPLPGIVVETILSWPAPRRRELIAFFSRVPGFEFAGENELAEAWLDAAAAAERPDRELLAFVASLRLDPTRVRKLALAYRDAGEPLRALAVLKRASLKGPKDADMLLESASRAASSGDEAAALELLILAGGMRLEPDRMRHLALAHRDMGRYARALSVLRRADMKGAADADTILDIAARAAREDRRPEALEALGFAEALSLDPGRKRALAAAYWSLGAHARSLAVLRRTPRGPEDLNALLTMAAEARPVRREAALQSLAFAESLALDARGVRALALAYRDAGAASRGAAVLKRAVLKGPADADLLLDLAAPESLAFAEAMDLDPERTRRLARAYRDLGRHARALAVMKRLPAEGSKDAGMLLGLADAAAKAGARGEALASLALAESLMLDQESLRRLAAGYRGLGESRSASRVFRRMGAAAGAWLDRAESAAAAGDRASALAHLARVSDAGLLDAEARRLVLLYQGLREYPAALETAERRVLARPGDARWRSDRGVLHALMGKREKAEADWRAALALDPSFPEPRRSLGSTD